MRERIAWFALTLVTALTLANLAFNVVEARRGAPPTRSSFLFEADDNFADFFSLLDAYPGGQVAYPADRAGLHAIVPVAPPSRYLGPPAPPPLVTHFHMMPLPTLIDLGLIPVISRIDSVRVFVGLTTLLLAVWVGVLTRFAATRTEAVAWAGLGLFAYPTLMMLCRGNLFAGMTAICLVASMLLALERRAPVICAVLLAIAVNIRPNAIVLAVPLLMFHWQARIRFTAALAASGLGIVGISFLAAHHFYPAYGPASFLHGLRAYHHIYVTAHWGLSYGSSLFGGVTLMLGEVLPGAERGAMLTALASIAAATVLHIRGKLGDVALLFVTLAAYCLGSTVFADYHLMAFIAVPMALAMRAPIAADRDAATARNLVLVTTCLVLAPKNYAFLGKFSAQVILNPMLLLGAALTVVAMGAMRSRDQTALL